MFESVSGVLMNVTRAFPRITKRQDSSEWGSQPTENGKGETLIV
jgi:hypothetical protein